MDGLVAAEPGQLPLGVPPGGLADPIGGAVNALPAGESRGELLVADEVRADYPRQKYGKKLLSANIL